MFGDVNYDPNKSIDDYKELTCDETVTLLEYAFGDKNVYLVEEADSIFEAHGKKFMRFELNRLNLRWGYHYGKPEGYGNDVICIYTKEESNDG